MDGRRGHERSARATERGRDIHSITVIFPDVLTPNASLRFDRNLPFKYVWMVLVE
jgi:hypothetical protein